MKFLVIGDLHGNKPGIYFKDYDAIIAPGDFCSTDELRKLMFENLRKRLANPRYKQEWFELVGKRKAKEMINKSLRDGRAILEFLNSFNIPVFTVPGNNDFPGDSDSKWDFLRVNHFKGLIKGLSNIIDIHERRVSVDDVDLVGYGLSSSPEYPQYDEDLKRYKPVELKRKLKSYEKGYVKISKLFVKGKPVVFLSHNVPFNTPVDVINNSSSPRNGQHFGSLIARRIVDEHQPLVCVGGHMHEHFAKCVVGGTLVINAGYGSGVNVLLEISRGRVVRSVFHKELKD